MKNKTSYLVGLLATLICHAAPAVLSKTDDLKVDCSATAKVVAVSDATYTPPRPPAWRFPGAPASAFFKASVQFVSTTPGCSILETKYAINLTPALYVVTVTINNPVDQVSTAGVAENAIGSLVGLKVQQDFMYVANDKYLPLFPKVHDEKIKLAGKALIHGKAYQAFGNVAFSITDVYGIPPVEFYADRVKLELAKKLIWHLDELSDQDYLSDFGHLFLKLEPLSVSAKKEYAQLIWLIFETIKQKNAYTHFFHFETGGKGWDVGRPFARKLIDLSHVDGVLETDEKIALLSEYPTLFDVGYIADHCFNATPAEVEATLLKIQNTLPHATGKYKYEVREGLESLGRPNLGSCFFNDLTPQAKVLASAILDAAE